MNPRSRRGGAALAVVVVLAIIAALIAFAVLRTRSRNEGPSGQDQPIATASYACDGGKHLTASYYKGESKPAAGPGQPPIPGGSIVAVLGDGRTFSLPQTISADGARYANADETEVLWNRGNTIMVLENGQETYRNCIEVAKDPGGLPEIYSSGSQGFSIRYPAGYTVDPNHVYQALGPGKDIAGAKFTIASSVMTGTNLSSDTYLSVETVPHIGACTADLFLGPDGAASGLAVHSVTDGAVTYSVASSAGAGAGNRYEETVYALSDTNPCRAVRYFIHYGAIQNYEPGAVREFDKQALLDQFDAIRRTLIVGQ